MVMMNSFARTTFNYSLRIMRFYCLKNEVEKQQQNELCVHTINHLVKSIRPFWFDLVEWE